MSRGWAALAATACLAAGCTSGSDRTSPTPSRTPTPSASVTTPAGEALAELARRAAHASYHASYVARQLRPASKADWSVWHTPRSVRVDVTEHKVTATLIVTPHGAYSCRRKGHRRTCFLVAHAGKPVPTPFNLAPQSLFAADVTALATATGTYTIRAAGSVDGGPARPDATCFSIRATKRSPKPHVPTGVYCFAGTGALTSIRYPSGNTVLMTSVRMTSPPSSQFRPYSSPTPVAG